MNLKTMSRLVRTDLVKNLTPRELQVFRLLADGLTAKQIAVELGVARATVDAHQHNIKRKLRCPNMNQLLRMAVLWSFVYGDLPKAMGGAA